MGNEQAGREKLKIVSLDVSNLMRVRAVHIEPNGSPVVVLGGRNEQGKTSVLSAIEMALAGKGAACPQPIRSGARSAEVVLDVGKYKITRKFTARGTTLEVRSGDGEKFSSPQSLLDSLVGDLSFDPLAFSRQPPKQQSETLRKLSGLDFSAIEAKRAKAYESRTETNRDIKRMEAQVASIAVDAGAPTEEISMSALVEELESAQGEHEKRGNQRRKIESLQARVDGAESEVARLTQALATAQVELDESRLLLSHEREVGAKVDSVSLPDLVAIRERIGRAENDNARVRAMAQRAKLVKELAYLQKKAKSLSDSIEGVDAEKLRLVSEAALPVPGMAFDADGVTIDGVPFEQCSSAQKIKASVAVGLASDPELPVMFVRDGSLLDADSRESLRQLAEQHNAQLWMEVVGDVDATVVIEDGAIFGAEDARLVESHRDDDLQGPQDPAANAGTDMTGW